MVFPQLVLAAACILFGIFPFIPLYWVTLAVSGLIPGLPIATYYFGLITEIGVWMPTVAALLIFISILVGALIYYVGLKVSPTLPTDEKYKVFIGGEEINLELSSFTSYHFYSPVKSSFNSFYKIAERGGLDWLNYGIAKLIDKACNEFRKVHTGILKCTSFGFYWP
jgi:hypothetical protein